MRDLNEQTNTQKIRRTLMNSDKKIIL